ncbi:hypothetical protein AALO_G00158810 [Alosa alosa]|uniref:Zinc-binding protein A33-like n=1 Tax=Alosa alosa TaxID=278164 RepID=A0AAV6GFT8_9TELE|nr:zinc-binding protein A33-like [Alosa alosa]KAG5274068.1 hypothetical protein AALO_G00158810 [Alosa alosa]
MEALLMAREALVCPLCCEVFKYPVTLLCGHSCCKMCLQDLWERKGARECPICRRLEITQRPPINLTLKIAADRFQLEQRAAATMKLEEVCAAHNETYKLFCQRDELPICLVCQLSKEHKNHECCAIADAAKDRKAGISPRYNSLSNHLSTLERVRDNWGETEVYIKTQADETERLIKEEFQKLHSFLWEEEAARLTLLREEEERKAERVRTKLDDICKQVEDLSAIIRDAGETMNNSDIKFLKDYKKTISRLRYTMQEPEVLSEALIDSALHVSSLKYDVWKKMAAMAHHCPLYLDPNTAQANLILSDEFTSVHYGKKRPVPSNHERCSSRMAVLGAAGFTSGKHSWDVDVGEGTNWYIGVARESINRKDTVFLNPAEGFWVIGLCNSDNYWAQTSPRTRLVVRSKPQRITVELDYDKGKVTFLNATDCSVMHTFRDKFTERVFAFFSPGMYEEGKSSPSPLKICPLKNSILLY